MLKEPGETEAEIARIGTAKVLGHIISDKKPGPPCFPPRGNGFGINPNATPQLASWFSEEDLKYYATKYDQKGFTGPLNYYRALDLYVNIFFHFHISNQILIMVVRQLLNNLSLSQYEIRLGLG